MFLKTGHRQEQSLKLKLAHTLKLSRHLKMGIKVVYRTQLFCSHHWCKSEKLMIYTVARDSHSAATCTAHTFFQRKGGRGENSSCNLHTDLTEQQNKSCSSRSFIHSTTHLSLYHCCRPWDTASQEKELLSDWLSSQKCCTSVAAAD